MRKGFCRLKVFRLKTEGERDLRFLYIAFRSLRELYYQLSLSKHLGLLNEKDNKIVENEKVLNGLIGALKNVST